ncbi:hypothetical protein SAMN05216281_1336 [Cryobacterium luteum]|nr:hypothetical protein SAMN05216281_1336 [Cryobacterium luteum]
MLYGAARRAWCGQAFTYGSTLLPPVDNYSYGTYEVPGYGLGIHWTCDTGW